MAPKNTRSGDPSKADGSRDVEEQADSSPQAVNTSRTLYPVSTSNPSTPGPQFWSPDESSSLLRHRQDVHRSYTSSRIPSRVASATATPRQNLTRSNSFANTDRLRRHNPKAGSAVTRLANALGRSNTWSKAASLVDSSLLPYDDDRLWYDQFTSIDWVHDNITDALRHNDLKSRADFRGRAMSFFYGAQGWIITAVVGFLFAAVAYVVVIGESSFFDIKFGYCQLGWLQSQKTCCAGALQCEEWLTWAEVLNVRAEHATTFNFTIYLIVMITLAALSCLLTMATAIVVPSHVAKSNLIKTKDVEEDSTDINFSAYEPDQVFYSAAGSGVAEVRVILSGFILHGYLGFKTLVLKTCGLILSVASGLTVGKEGPYVHISTCISNVMCRFFAKYRRNDGKKREILSAGAASGVAVAFGAPISGVLFSLEEVSYYFPAKTLFRTFFCCIIAALSLKAFDPYGTNRIVMFQVHYTSDWRGVEMAAFVLLGILGGALGALFIKASRLWANTFRRWTPIKRYPVLEVIFVAAISGVISYWNRYTKLPVADLLYELASECSTFEETRTGLCPTKDGIPGVVGYLSIALVVKAFLTTITFGTKVPGGIYVPSMVVGGLVGRIIGHALQYFIMEYTTSPYFGQCTSNGNPESCIVPGVYALIAAGATMCGVTRLSVTLVVILFELTGSLDHVLPFSIAVMVSKWTADAIEPLSIYDLLTESNGYPFLDQKYRPIMTGELGDITPRFRHIRVINITESPVVPAHVLRQKLEFIRGNGEIDGGLPVVRDGMLVGIVPAPDLEFALDRLEDEQNTMCLMSSKMQYHDDELQEGEDLLDFTPYIDESPIALDLHSSMELAYELFVKLGLRYIGVHRDGYYVGLVHKKAFVKFLRDMKKDS